MACGCNKPNETNKLESFNNQQLNQLNYNRENYNRENRETLTIDGMQFNIKSNIPLTPEQRNDTIRQLRELYRLNNSQNPTDRYNIANLAVTCPPAGTTKVTGNIITLSQTPTGTGPFTVTFWRQPHGTVTKTNLPDRTSAGYPNPRTGITTGTVVNYQYPVVSTDSGPTDFGATVVDDTCGSSYNCGGTEFCYLNLNKTVTVTSPNTGLTWYTTEIRNITWTSSGITNINIYLYKTGAFNSTIASNISASTGTVAWTIPTGSGLNGNDYKIVIADATDSNIYDMSDVNFTILPMYICQYILDMGGIHPEPVAVISKLIGAYLNLPGFNTGFTVSASHIAGAIAYYLFPLIPSIGNGQTGCTFT